MITLLFVSDGERDHAMLPHLVARLLGVTVQARTSRWARLHQRGAAKGFHRKLLYATAQARNLHAAGLVATVDRDRAARRERLRELCQGREDDRCSNPPLPTALGEAVPHGEAWLLDDQVALRQALRLPGDCRIPSIREGNPKEVINSLLAESERCDDDWLDVFRDIAQQLEPSRCVHAHETGFEQFVAEVRQELRRLISTCGEDCRCGDACAIEPLEGE